VEIIERLGCIFDLANQLGLFTPGSCLLRRSISISLEVLLKFDDKTLRECVGKWGLNDSHREWVIGSRLDVVKWQLHLLATIVKQAARDPDSWASLANCLLTLYRLVGDEKCLNR